MFFLQLRIKYHHALVSDVNGVFCGFYSLISLTAKSSGFWKKFARALVIMQCKFDQVIVHCNMYDCYQQLVN